MGGFFKRNSIPISSNNPNAKPRLKATRQILCGFLYGLCPNLTEREISMKYLAVTRFYDCDDEYNCAEIIIEHTIEFDTLEAAREFKRNEEAEDPNMSVYIYEAKRVC